MSSCASCMIWVWKSVSVTASSLRVKVLTKLVDVGSCPTTGVIGVAFGAGLGRLQGKYGFLNDNMVSCKLVLADGSVVVASKDSHPDLFWAIRGAGHNFGIAVEVTFQVYPQPHGGIHHTWDLEYTLDQCDAVFETLNSVYETMPADLAIFVLWLRQSSGRKVGRLTSEVSTLLTRLSTSFSST